MNDHTLDMLLHCGLITSKPIPPNNWTADMVFKVATIFCQKIKMDMEYNDQDLFDNLSCLDEGVSDESKTLKLYCALQSIIPDIFLDNFKLTDILNPAFKGINKHQKKLQKMANFLLFQKTLFETPNWQEFMKDMENEMELKRENAKTLREIQEMKNKLIRKFGEVTAEIEESERKIVDSYTPEEVKLTREISEIVEDMTNDELENEQILKEYKDVKTSLENVTQETENMESSVVRSPDKYEQKLMELQKLRNNSVEECQVITDSAHKIRTLGEFLEQAIDAGAQFFPIWNKHNETLEIFLADQQTKTHAKKDTEEKNAHLKQLLDEKEKNAVEEQTSSEELQLCRSECDKLMMEMSTAYNNLMNNENTKAEIEIEKRKKYEQLNKTVEELTAELEKRQQKYEEMADETEKDYEVLIDNWELRKKKTHGFAKMFDYEEDP